MLLPAPLLNGVRREYQISHLFDVSPIDPTIPGERRLLGLVLPPWQRPEVWTVEQKVRFIEGVFLGLGTGYYVVHAPDWEDSGKPKRMAGWLLDGQQRITAIRDFMADRFSIFDGVLFSSLDHGTARRRFLFQSFPCFEVTYTWDESLLRDLYDRLIFGGTPHTPDQRP